MTVLSTCIHVYHVCAQCQVKSEGNFRSAEPGVMGSCKLPYRSWEPTPGPLQEQQAFFTKPSLYYPSLYHLNKNNRTTKGSPPSLPVTQREDHVCFPG